MRTRLRNITITLEESIARWARIEAARRDNSVSRLLAGILKARMLEEDAYQCGYCTSGQMVNVEGLLRKTPDPTIEQIREGVSGNLCRCGAYAHIFRAAHRAAELKKAGR